jgi:glycine/sarcosine N-methyltransferase
MSIYNIIAKNYSDIFPSDKKRTEFIKSFCRSEDCKILDIGCATGDLAFELGNSGYEVTGIDLNEKMISIAQSRIPEKQNNIRFHLMNMLDIEKLGFFDLILCFGNTLPHLQNSNEIREFFQTANNQLHDNGSFIFQILNYDKILDQKNINFPVIENDTFKFTRNYSSIKEDSVIFNITFLDKIINRRYSDSMELLPAKRDILITFLKETGFKGLKIFSDYSRTESDLNEFASVYVAQK